MLPDLPIDTTIMCLVFTIKSILTIYFLSNFPVSCFTAHEYINIDNSSTDSWIISEWADGIVDTHRCRKPCFRWKNGPDLGGTLM